MAFNGNQEEQKAAGRSSQLTLVSSSSEFDPRNGSSFLSHQQTFSIGASSSFGNKTTSMLNKGYDLTAMACAAGKVVAAFTKDSGVDELTIVEMENDDQGVSHAYRLGQCTLRHVAHDGSKWLFAYRQGKHLGSQKIVRCQSANEVLIEIKKHWPHQFWVTSIAYGNGCWIVVFSKTSAVHQQSFFLARDNETLQVRTRKAWKDGKKISAIAFGDGQWLVVMSKSSTSEAQKWFSQKSFVDLKKRIRQEWLNGFRLSSITYGTGVWLAVVTRPSN